MREENKVRKTAGTGSLGRRLLLRLLLCAAVIAGSLLALTSAEKHPALFASGEITNWGLSFQQEGQPPVGNAAAEDLARYDALYCVPTEEKVLYLTFDAGYENGNTRPILDAMAKHNVKGIFFLVGNFLEREPDLVRQMLAEGHTVGNHTYSHPDMSAIQNKADFLPQLQKNEALYREITGEEMAKFYRPPQGKYCEDNLRMAQELGYTTVFWSLAYVDWLQDAQPSREEAMEKLTSRIHPGAIVLLHSTSSTNALVLDELLSRWEEMGYRVGDPGELGVRSEE